ncbi:MAG: MOSC domain-containing protein [Thermodesulfobacteriota bacterium]
MPHLHAICLSAEKHTRKHEVAEAEVREDFGLVGDAHAGTGRQVSLLALEAIGRMCEKLPGLKPGDFAENLTLQGLDPAALPVGQRLRVGDAVLLEITQIGKTCHHGCEIRRLAGDCIMPREGVFARVLAGGAVRKGDPVVLLD